MAHRRHGESHVVSATLKLITTFNTNKISYRNEPPNISPDVSTQNYILHFRRNNVTDRQNDATTIATINGFRRPGTGTTMRAHLTERRQCMNRNRRHCGIHSSRQPLRHIATIYRAPVSRIVTVMAYGAQICVHDRQYKPKHATQIPNP